MAKKIKYLLLTLILLFCVNTGFQSSEKKDTPTINFYGEITANNQTEQADNITIGGLYEDIPLYGIPALSETSPSTNITHVRLDDIQAIAHTIGKESIKEFKKRDYVEIELEFKNKKKQKYLIERARKIYYEVPFSDPKIAPLEKELAPEALQKIVIKGHLQKARTHVIEPEKKSAAREAVCTKAKDNLKELEKIALNSEEKIESRKILNNINEAVDYLCA